MSSIPLTVPKISDKMAPVLRSQGAAIIDMVGGYLPPKIQGVKLLAPCPLWKGGDEMVTYTELFMFCTMVISLISLIIQIKKK